VDLIKLPPHNKELTTGTREHDNEI